MLAPTQLDVVVRGGEARQRAAGLEPFGDYRDDLTLEELKADTAAKAEQKKIAAQAAADKQVQAAPVAPTAPAAA